MKWETTSSFASDYRRLTPDEKRMFRTAVEKFNDACDRAMEEGERPQWPTSLRIKDVEGAPGVWEMTWSFSGPGGRATWEWITIHDDAGRPEPAVRWRRIGGHEIFSSP